MTPADFVRGRFGSRTLALAVALTGIVATMPYIALQLVGMQVVIGALDRGVTRRLAADHRLRRSSPPSPTSGLRAPALIAVVKDMLIYITVFAAVIFIPAKLGGFGAIFDAAGKALPEKDSAGRADPGTARRADRLRDARARLGAGAVPLSARDDRRR